VQVLSAADHPIGRSGVRKLLETAGAGDGAGQEAA
jgi:hypothetical protein